MEIQNSSEKQNQNIKKVILVSFLGILLVAVVTLFYFEKQMPTADEIVSKHIESYKNANDSVMSDIYDLFIDNYRLSDDDFRPVFFEFFEKYFDLLPIPNVNDISPELIVEYEKQYTEFFYRFDDYSDKRMLPGNSSLVAHYLFDGDAVDLMEKYPAASCVGTRFDDGGIFLDDYHTSFVTIPAIEFLNPDCFAVSLDLQVDTLSNFNVITIGEQPGCLGVRINNIGMIEVYFNDKTIIESAFPYKSGEMFRVFVSYYKKNHECVLFVDNQFNGKVEVDLNNLSPNQIKISKFVGKIRNMRIFSDTEL